MEVGFPDSFLNDIKVPAHHRSGLACGGNGGVFRLTNEKWRSEETPTDEHLGGVMMGRDNRWPNDIAVGDNSTIIEKPSYPEPAPPSR